MKNQEDVRKIKSAWDEYRDKEIITVIEVEKVLTEIKEEFQRYFPTPDCASFKFVANIHALEVDYYPGPMKGPCPEIVISFPSGSPIVIDIIKKEKLTDLEFLKGVIISEITRKIDIMKICLESCHENIFKYSKDFREKMEKRGKDEEEN